MNPRASAAHVLRYLADPPVITDEQFVAAARLVAVRKEAIDSGPRLKSHNPRLRAAGDSIEGAWEVLERFRNACTEQQWRAIEWMLFDEKPPPNRAMIMALIGALHAVERVRIVRAPRPRPSASPLARGARGLPRKSPSRTA